MNRWARYLPLGILFGVVTVPPAYLVSSAQEPTKEPGRPAPEVIAAWEKAGAKFGWTSVDESGRQAFLSDKEKPVAGAVPAFYVEIFPTGKLKALPPPEVPFYLAGSKAHDAGLKELAGLTQLQGLALGGTQVTDAGLKELARFNQLQLLVLLGTKVTDAGMKELAALKQLQWLDLSATKVTDTGLKELTGLKQLQTLNLLSTQVTDAGLKELAGLKQLRSLDLCQTKVTDAGLRELAGLKQLQTLYLARSQVTDAGVQELQKALPQVRIIR